MVTRVGTYRSAPELTAGFHNFGGVFKTYIGTGTEPEFRMLSYYILVIDIYGTYVDGTGTFKLKVYQSVHNLCRLKNVGTGIHLGPGAVRIHPKELPSFTYGTGTYRYLVSFMIIILTIFV